MPAEDPTSGSPFPAEVRARLAADIAAGKTIALSATDLSEPALREHLPFLLEELARGAPTIAAGLTVPGYTILAAIGQGGMSVVYLARHEALGRHVALKVGTPGFGGDEKVRRRLLEEARLLARVAHPNIVTIHDVIAVNDTIVIAMEWVDGLTLAGLLRQMPPRPDPLDMTIAMQALGTPETAGQRFATTPVRFLVRLIHDVARALHCVHQAGMMHLDVKPSNVLLRRDATPLLADFGVGRELNPRDLQTRSFAGTPVYSAPEQLRPNGDMGPHTDVYGLGMTLYEVLARSQPLLELDLAGLLQVTASGRMPALSTLVPIAHDLETIVHKAISPEPAHRYATAAAFADDLLAFLEHRPVSARPLTRVQRLRRWARHEPWKATLVVVLLVTLPTLIGLGSYLRMQLPRIEAQRQQERRAEANHLKQAAYRAYFSQLFVREPSALLRRAMELEPGDTAFACLLSMAIEEDDAAEAQAVLHHNDAAVQRHLGFQLLAQKLDRGRSFFDEEQLTDLRGSDDPIDHYVLALDRTFHAEDAANEDAYAEAAACLTDITLRSDADPMVFGLQAWCTVRAGQRGTFDDLCRAMEARWPDDADVQAWHAIAIEPIDPSVTDSIASRMIENRPGDALGWELSIGCALRRNSPDLTPRLAGAAAAGIRSPQIDLFRALAAAKGDAQNAKAALDSLPVDRLSLRRRLELLHTIDPARARDECAQASRNPDLPWLALADAYGFATAHEMPDLATQVFERFHTRSPERVLLHRRQIQTLYDQKQLDEAAALARTYTYPRNALPTDAPRISRILIAVRDWQALRDLAQRWQQATEGTAQAEAEFFFGMALSRLGLNLEAAPPLARCIAIRIDNKTWYATALLESAWLKVAPDGHRDLQDPAGAARLIDMFDAISRTRPLQIGPWTALVRAAVRDANGDRAGAIQELDHSGPMRRLEPTAPANTAELIATARERYAR